MWLQWRPLALSTAAALPLIILAQFPEQYSEWLISGFGYPPCAVKCLESATLLTFCPLLNATCYCTDGFELLVNKSAECLARATPGCSQEDWEKGNDAALKHCFPYRKAAGLNTSPTLPTRANVTISTPIASSGASSSVPWPKDVTAAYPSPPKYEASSTPSIKDKTAANTTSQAHTLSAGAYAGIGVSAGLVGIIIIGIGAFGYRRRRLQKQPLFEAQDGSMRRGEPKEGRELAEALEDNRVLEMLEESTILELPADNAPQELGNTFLKRENF